MTEILRRCGIDVDSFDEKGNKTLAQLFEEHVNSEVNLLYDEKRRLVIRTAFTATVLVTVPSRSLKLVEQARQYPSRKLPDGTVVPMRLIMKKKEWSISETRRRGFKLTSKYRKLFEAMQAKEIIDADASTTVESIVQTAVRGLIEELSIVVREDQLRFIFAEGTRGHEFPVYLSTAYHQIWSHAHIQRFLLELPDVPAWLKHRSLIHRDNGVVIHLGWEDY